MNRKPIIQKGPASSYELAGEAIYEFTDHRSGGLIAIRRAPDTGHLIVDLYRMDPDVLVRTPKDGANDWRPTAEPEATTDTFTVNVPHTYRTGWGVAVVEFWSDEDDEHRIHITGIEVEVVRIAADTVRVVGEVPCVHPAGAKAVSDPGYGAWYPVENFRDLPDLTADDSHDLRMRWFATEDEAREHAARLRHEWDNPLPWQPFAVTS